MPPTSPTPPEHPRVAEVARLLRAAGATGTVRHLPDSAPTAAAAAAQLGVAVGAIANSLLFDVGGNPLLVLTSGAHRVDEVTVAALLGVPAISRATPETSMGYTLCRPSFGRRRSVPALASAAWRNWFPRRWTRCSGPRLSRTTARWRGKVPGHIATRFHHDRRPRHCSSVPRKKFPILRSNRYRKTTAAQSMRR